MADAKSFECKELGCDQRVYWEQRDDTALHLKLFRIRGPEEKPTEMTAHLTCPAGHTHEYVVSVS